MFDKRYFLDGTVHFQTPSGNRRMFPVKPKGKKMVKALKRTRTYDKNGVRVS